MSQRYEIKERIGRGGIGAIYRAQDTIMGREVAIKRLLPLDQTHLNESADESLQREAAALARFQHPNILTIFAFESDDEGPYVVMELLQGENLKEVIKRGALTLEDFDDLVMQSLDPLIAAQQMNLLHRDIKPQNIMLTWLASGRFHIKLLDFGLAKFTQAPSKQTLDQTGSFLGSIDYIAPEQIELEPLDQRTDLYALGCVFYYCLTQRAPFAADSNARTIQNHLNHVTTPVQTLRPDLPAPVANWVMRLISRRPEHRPSNALAAMKEYEQVKTGVTVLSAADLESDAPSVKVMPSPREESPPGTSPTAPPRRIITGPVKRHTQPTRTVTGPVRQASQPIRGLSQPL
ncbi:MAG: protein kinase, partial [Verrucomicrobiales bacterium]|nr:protein kinase [Verrucomicrobiales bacterium]